MTQLRSAGTYAGGSWLNDEGGVVSGGTAGGKLGTSAGASVTVKGLVVVGVGIGPGGAGSGSSAALTLLNATPSAPMAMAALAPTVAAVNLN
jgi:hypothetical protein